MCVWGGGGCEKPKKPISMYMLGQWPNLRTINNLRTGKHFHKGPC